MEVWIYFLSQKFCRSAEIGTLSSLLSTRSNPQYVVAFLTTMSLRFAPYGKVKSRLTIFPTLLKFSQIYPP
jgi:hypothetical protein